MKRKQNLFILLTLLTLTGGMKLFAEEETPIKDEYIIEYRENKEDTTAKSIGLVLKQEGINKKVKILNKSEGNLVDLFVGFIKEDNNIDILYPAEIKENKEKIIEQCRNYSNEMDNLDEEKFTIINSYGGKTEISNAKFFVKKESNGNGNMNNQKGELFVTIPETKGNLIIVSKKRGETEVVRFTYNTSFAEILKSKNTATAGNEWTEWLKAADKSTIEEKEEMYTGLSQKTFDALLCEKPYEKLYTSEDTYLYRKYLKLKYENKYINVVYSKDDRNDIASQAEKYLYQAVEYETKVGKEKIELYKYGDDIFADSFWKTQNRNIDGYKVKNWHGIEVIGNPIPYCKDGCDDPENFKKNMEKMMTTAVGKGKFNTTNPKNLNGTRINRSKYNIKYFGIDNKGLLENITKKIVGEETKYKKEEYNNIEKNIALIPDLTMAERGDIIILKQRDNLQNLTKGTGIIISVNGVKDEDFGTNQESFYKNIYAVYVDEKTEYVTVLNMEEIQKKAENSTLLIGRLVKETDKERENTIAYIEQAKNFNWNIEDITPASYKVTIGKMRETTQKNEEKYRWIPNTGEYLELSDIKVSVKTKTGVNLTGVNSKLVFTGLQDRDYEIDPNGDNGNIYKNKANEFKIRLYGQGKSNDAVEKSIKKNSEGLYEYEQGKEISINYLGILMDGTNPLVIAVRPESSAKAYPGDDFLLRFKFINKINNTELKSFNSDEKDYVAVYDKKMLWRANLYIDEEGDDWNDIHPWNAPASNGTTTGTWGDTNNPQTVLASWNCNDWGYNEWNKVITYNNDGTVASTVTGNGGQQLIYEWTRYTDGNTVNSSIAYGWGCWDSFEQFNKELIQQRQAVKNYRTQVEEVDNVAQQNADTNSSATQTIPVYNTLQWQETQTTAPGTGEGTARWKNYIFPERKKTGGKAVYGEGTSSDIEQFPYYVSTNRPSVPCLSTSDDDVDMYEFSSTKYTSGIDCSGFAIISANYNNNKYKLPDIDESIFVGKNYGSSDFVSTDYTYNIQSDPWVLDSDSSADSISRKKQQEKLKHAVPGDVLAVHDSGGHHVVIIQNLNYPFNSDVITDYTQVDVIHSIPYIRDEKNLIHQNMVRKNTWQVIQIKVTVYKLRRLLENE